MLTFSFTGVDGTMTESETLTSGMVGKQVLIRFDDSWANLNKTVVFRAADINRVVINPTGDTVVIPEAVLARPFGKLFVGVYGTGEDGTVVIPTIMAEGPMIRYGADPIEDETARELPVWENLQNQIGSLEELKTEDAENLVAAVNEVCEKEAALASEVEDIQEMMPFIGEPLLLQTQDKTSLVGAVNELHSELARCVGLTPAAAQLLVDILSSGVYNSGQEEAIDALAAELGATVNKGPTPILYWDFRTGSLTDQMAGLDAVTAEGVTLDTDGAHLDASNSSILIPADPAGGTLSGHTAEIKFGPMSLDTGENILRLAATCMGSQPATSGIMWSGSDCWTAKTAVVTEFTDLNMFSGKTLVVKGHPDSNQIDWMLDDQVICSTTPTSTHTHLSIGCSIGAAFPLVVEYVKIYPLS